jgi:polar amino acid transport system substrate-binding protein
MNDDPHQTTTHKLQCLVLSIALVAALASAAVAGAAYKLPQFRNAQVTAAAPTLPAGTSARLLTDNDFPPFSFTAANGAMAGLAVELALAACGELKITCEVMPRPLTELLPALKLRRGDLVIAGPRIEATTLAEATMTRPWFRSFGRFAVQSGKIIEASDARALAKMRIGVVKASSHAVWLQTYYTSSQIVDFETIGDAEEALRTGNVDILFGDGLQLIYWVTGSASRDCCKLLPGAYTDFDTFSRNYAFVMRSEDVALRDAFDWALDRLQANGTTERLFNAYVPLSPW